MGRLQEVYKYDMVKARHYAKAPIKEALIDIKFKLPPDVTPLTLSSIFRKVSDDYPQVENTLSVENKSDLKVGQSVLNQTKTSFTGSRFLNHDGNQIFQARTDGFTFSRLSPYEDWQSMRKEAQKLLNVYVEHTKAQEITQITVRYINKLALPLPMQDFSVYLRTVPDISADLPQGVSDYLMQLRIPDQEIDGLISITEAIFPKEQQEKEFLSVLLDIGLSCNASFKMDASTDTTTNLSDCWEFLEKLHVRKNDVFEACITDKTRELIS